MRWLCMNCVKPIEDKREVADVFSDLIQGKEDTTLNYQLSLDGRPLCPDCGCICIQVKDKEDGDENCQG